MTPPKSALHRKIAHELSLIDKSATPPLPDDCPEQAWLDGAAWMAEKIAKLLEDENEDAAFLLKRTVLGPVHLAKDDCPVIRKSAQPEV